MNNPTSFNQKIGYYFFVVGFVAFWTGFIITVFFETRQIKNEISSVMKDAASSCTALIHDSIHQNRRYIHQKIDAMPEGTDAEIREYFNRELPLLGPEDQYFVLNKEKEVIATTKGEEQNFIGIDFSYLEYVGNQAAISNIHQSLIDLHPVVTITYQLKQGRLLLVEKDLYSIAPLVQHLTQAGQLNRMFFFILTANGTVVYHPNEYLSESRYNLAFEFKNWSDSDAYGLQTYAHKGLRYLTYKENFSIPAGWTFYASIPYTYFLWLIGKHILLLALVVGIFFIALMTGLHFLIARKISNPINAVAEYLFSFNPMVESLSRKGLLVDSVELTQILDATERMSKNVKDAVNRLTDSENKFRNLVEQAGDGIFVHDVSGRILDVNQQGCEMLGYSKEELLRMSIFDIESAFDKERAKETWSNMQPGCPINISGESLKKDGTTFAADIRVGMVQVGAEEEKYFLAIVRDISERMRAQDELAREKELLSVTLRSIGDGVITTDINGSVLVLSRVAEELTGWTNEEAFGKQLTEVFNIFCEKTGDPCASPVKRVLESGEIVAIGEGVILQRRDGIERAVEDSGAPIRDKNSQIIGMVLVFRDVTEQRALEQEAQKVKKLESLGVLAGGIAHDFNNLLTAIWGNVSYAKVRCEPESEIFSYLAAAEKATQGAKNLTQQLLTFAKGGAPIKETTSIAEIISDSADFALRGSNVSFELSLYEDLWPVNVDPGQMSQVVNNLIINADQAMPTGGVIEIKARNQMVQPEDGLPLRPGRYVVVQVKDHGEGIPDNILQNIFDPYFTTKHKGSGLGLASSYSIAKRHNGLLFAESSTGAGSTFSLYLPASESQTIGDIAPSQKDDKIVPGKGKILVMDDEEMVTVMASKILEHLGYEVSVAEDGEEAIKKFGSAIQDGTPFDVVIMDLTVPGGMGGEQAVQELLKLDSDAKVIVSSGYAQDPIMSEYKKYGFSGILAKPYSIENLSKALHKLIQKAE